MYRDDTLIYTGPNTTNQYTDNTQLSISTVYEYSVVAVSCVGTSTAGVTYTSVGSYSLIDLGVSYENLTNEVHIDWVCPYLHHTILFICLITLDPHFQSTTYTIHHILLYHVVL